MLTQNISAKQLQDAMNGYKVGFNLQPKKAAAVDKTRRQTLPTPALATLIANTAEKLTNSLQTICPITGLTHGIDFPALPGFYIESYHPIVHNARAMIKKPDYFLMLNKEQKVGLILAALNFYSLLTLNSPALIISLAMQTVLSDHQLEQVADFIRDAVATTEKGYPRLELDASLSEQTILGYMTKCYDVEHASLVSEITVDELTKKLFEVPKFLASEKRGSAMDKEALELFSELVELELIPASLIASTKGFIKTLVTNPSSSLINKILRAVEAKAILPDNDNGIAEAAVNDFIDYVQASRETAEKLKLYPSLDDDLFSEPSVPAAQTGSAAYATEGATNAPTSVETAKVLSPFEARLAAMKAQGKL